MKTQEFNIVFNIDFNQLPRFNQDKPSVWGNVCTDTLQNKCYSNLTKFFPEANKCSPHFQNKVKMTIGLAFMRINEKGQTNCPNFNDFLTCSMMSVTQKDIQNPFDRRLYLNLNQLMLSGDVKLAS